MVEHLSSGGELDIASSSAEDKKSDSHNIEFPVTIAPDEEKIITDTARYTWQKGCTLYSFRRITNVILRRSLHGPYS